MAKRSRRVSSPRSAPLGCGIDVVELDRFRAAVTRGGRAFLSRVFTEHERRYANGHRNSLARLAARFAAKEAVVKAMAQVDPRHPVMLSQIEITNDAQGRPSVVLRHRRGPQPTLQISLSHADRVAVACAVAIR